LPAAADLPDHLQGLVQRQAVALRDETWHQDVEGLVRSLRGEPAVPTRRSRRRLVAGAVAVALVASGAAAWWWGPGTGGQAGSGAEVAACASPTGEGWRPMTLNKNPTGEDKVQGGSLLFRVKAGRWRAAREGTWQVMLTTSMENATMESYYHGDYRYNSLIVASGNSRRCASRRVPTWRAPGTVADALIGFEVSCKPVGYIQLMLEGDKDRISVTPDNLEPGHC
jgi:hypothetical protein